MRRLLRRLAWLLARLVLVIGLMFFVLARSTQPDQARCDDFTSDRLEESGLPVFVNSAPRDLTARVNAFVKRCAEVPTQRDADELHRLGGATLPLIMRQLARQPEGVRERVAWSLLPVLKRMAWRGAESIRTGAEAYEFLSGSWRERSVDFQPLMVQRWVERLAIRGGSALTASVLEYDTYALPALMSALPEPATAADVERARRLLDVAQRATGIPWGIAPRTEPREARLVVQHWRRWWQLHALEYQVTSGPARWSAMLQQTKFGQWTSLVFRFDFGTDRDQRFISARLLSAVFHSLLLLVAGTLGVIVVAVSHVCRRHNLTRWPLAVLVLASVPPIVVVATFSRLGLPHSIPSACAVAALSMLVLELGNSLGASVDGIAPTRPSTEPSAVLQTHQQTAPYWLFAGHTWPWLLTLSFCIERAFSVEGIGAACISAFRHRDLHLLMALTTTTAFSLLLVEFAVQLGRQVRRWRAPEESLL